MKKKYLAILAMTAVMCFTGCGGSNENSKNTTTGQSDIKENDTTATVDETNEDITEENTTVNQEELDKQKEEECRKALEGIEAEVLSVYNGSFEDAGIVNFDETEYDTATYITLGIKLPDGAYGNYKYIQISGETAENENGDPISQESLYSTWINEDCNYILAVMRVAGSVDTTKANLHVTGKNKKVVVDIPFANNGEVVGFDSAVEAFKEDEEAFGTNSSIIKLKGRHYRIIRRYVSGNSWGSDEDKELSLITMSYVLIPIENGFERTLTTEDVNLVIKEEIPNTSVKVLVNDRGMIDASSLDSQTTINFEISREITEQKNEEDDYDDEVYDKIKDDQTECAKNTYVEIDDGDGNTVILIAS